MTQCANCRIISSLICVSSRLSAIYIICKNFVKHKYKVIFDSFDKVQQVMNFIIRMPLPRLSYYPRSLFICMENASTKNWSDRSEVEIHLTRIAPGETKIVRNSGYIAAYTTRVNIIERLSPSMECYCEIVCE